MEEVQNEIIWGFLQSNINLGRGIKMFCENELFMTSFRGVSINFSCCLGKYSILYFRDLSSGDHGSPSLSSRNGKKCWTLIYFFTQASSIRLSTSRKYQSPKTEKILIARKCCLRSPFFVQFSIGLYLVIALDRRHSLWKPQAWF